MTPPPPPDYGQLIIGIRTILPDDPHPTLSGGMGETLDGLESFQATVSRADVVLRTVADDPATESVITVDSATHVVDFVTDLTDTSPRLFTFLAVPPGFVSQVRLIIARATIALRGESYDVKVPSGAETGIKIVPNDGVPFAVTTQQRTGARVLFEPFKQFIRNHGQGFMMKPVLEAEHVSLAELSPILLDRVVVGFWAGVDRPTIDAVNAELGTWIMSAWEPTSYYVMGLPLGVSLEDALAFYAGRDEVEYTLPDTLVYEQGNVYPCDPGFQNPGPFTVARFPEAWGIGTGNRTGRIAVIDGNFDLRTQPDLVRNWDINWGELLTAAKPRAIAPKVRSFRSDGV